MLLDLAARTGGVRDALLMLQKEVADRLVAKVGTGEYGVLTVLTALNADVTRVLSLPPGAFRPQPKVHSAVVRLSFRPPQVAIPDRSSGCLARHLLSARPTREARGPVRWGSRGVGASITAAMMLAWLGPSNALRPDSISNNTAPNEKMSLRASARPPSSCSGDM